MAYTAFQNTKDKEKYFDNFRINVSGNLGIIYRQSWVLLVRRRFEGAVMSN
jgi:hypothetical protein